MAKLKAFIENIQLATRQVFFKAPKAYIFIALVQAALAILPYVGAYYFGKIGAGVVDLGSPYEVIMAIAVIWVGISLLESICGTISTNFVIWGELHVYSSLQSDYLQQTNALDIGRTEAPDYIATFQKVKNAAYPPFKLQNFFEKFLTFVSSDLVRLVMSIIIIFQTDILYSILLIIFLLPKFISELVYGADQFDIWSNPVDARDRTELYSVHDQLDQREYKPEMILHGYVPALVKIFKDIFWRIVSRKHRSLKKKMLLDVLSDVLYQAGILLLLFSLIKQTVAGVYSFSFFTLVFYSLGQISASVNASLSAIAFLITVNPIITEVRKIYEMKSLLVTASAPEKADMVTSKKDELITFENVSFKYVGTDTFQSKNMNLTINKGERLAVIGLNGAGKSTFIKLLSRIYDPVEGEVRVEDAGHMRPLNSIHPEEWHTNISCLFQDYARYHFTVRNYISFNAPYDEERLKKAIEMATAEFVYELPNKLDQQLGVDLDGVDLSKGQWQKLALARTLYRECRILILDEPTATVDAISARRIYENLRNLPEDKTLIFISHNMVDIPFVATRIMLIEHGEIIGIGTHKQLLAKSKAYRELYESAQETDK